VDDVADVEVATILVPEEVELAGMLAVRRNVAADVVVVDAPPARVEVQSTFGSEGGPTQIAAAAADVTVGAPEVDRAEVSTGEQAEVGNKPTH
jgi:hypothetical protein